AFSGAGLIVFATEHSLAEGAPRGNSEAHRLGHRQEVAFGRSFDEGVFDLQTDKGGPTTQSREGLSLRDAPGRGVGNPRIQYLSGANKVIKTTHDFLDGSSEVPDVQPIEIDVVGFQPLEARLDRLDHVLAVVARSIDVLSHVERIFGCQYPAVAVSSDEIAKNLFAVAISVEIGGVDEVASGSAKEVEHFATLIG